MNSLSSSEDSGESIESVSPTDKEEQFPDFEESPRFRPQWQKSNSLSRNQSSKSDLRLADITHFDFEPGKKMYEDLNLTLVNPSRDSSTGQEASKIIAEIRKRNLIFPLLRYYTSWDTILQCWNNVRKYEPHWKERSHTSLKGHDSSLCLPTLFRGKGCQLIVQRSDWWNVDYMVDFFTEYERIRAKKEYTVSLAEAWNDDSKLHEALLHAGKEITCQTLRNSLFRCARELVPFRISRARALAEIVLSPETPACQKPNQLRGKRWLDISSGWGDRLIAACSLEMDYVGFDPNPSLVQGHQEIIKSFGLARNHKGSLLTLRDPTSLSMKSERSCENDEKIREKIESGNGEEMCQEVNVYPFESAESQRIIEDNVKKHGLFDLCLTSPPFFIIERYNGPNQSTENYPKFEEWMVKFLFRSLWLAWSHLKENGYLAINIADIRGCKMVEPTIIFMEDFCVGSSWEGTITYSGRSTQDVPGSVYIWQKRNTSMKNQWNTDVKRCLHEMYPRLFQKWIELL